jgi:hypothetical protein
MKRTSLTLTGYNADTQLDRLKVIRILQPSVFSLNNSIVIAQSFEREN